MTGSAHSALAPFWAARLGKNEMTGFQASARGGVVKVRLEGDRVVHVGPGGHGSSRRTARVNLMHEVHPAAGSLRQRAAALLGTWRNVYIFVLGWLALLIVLFYAFTRYFA